MVSISRATLYPVQSLYAKLAILASLFPRLLITPPLSCQSFTITSKCLLKSLVISIPKILLQRLSWISRITHFPSTKPLRGFLNRPFVPDFEAKGLSLIKTNRNNVSPRVRRTDWLRGFSVKSPWDMLLLTARSVLLALLKQQGSEPRLGLNWVSRFIKYHAELRTKIGKQQEANRFDSFTPKAIYWFFNIREKEYG